MQYGLARLKPLEKYLNFQFFVTSETKALFVHCFSLFARKHPETGTYFYLEQFPTPTELCLFDICTR